jgi:hypothetical protein
MLQMEDHFANLEDRAFAEPGKAPAAWFADVLVERALVTAGARECMKDDIVGFAEGLKVHHMAVELAVQKNGLHVDPYLDFMVGEKRLGILTPLLIDWFAAGFI